MISSGINRKEKRMKVVRDETKMVRVSAKVHRKLRRFAFFREIPMMKVVDAVLMKHINKLGVYPKGRSYDG